MYGFMFLQACAPRRLLASAAETGAGPPGWRRPGADKIWRFSTRREQQEEIKMPAERFDFSNAEGLRLAGLLDSPPGEARAYALFAHCFTCGKDVHAAKRI